jgi:hypothetical protein
MDMVRLKIICAYCGGACRAGETNCPSCGSRIPGASDVSVSGVAGRRTEGTFLALAVWLLLGLFGGYAYWTGHKAKAYARVAMWLSLIGWMALGVAADQAGHDSRSLLFGLAFFATLLLILLLWLLDLAHLLRKAKASG